MHLSGTNTKHDIKLGHLHYVIWRDGASLIYRHLSFSFVICLQIRSGDELCLAAHFMCFTNLNMFPHLNSFDEKHWFFYSVWGLIVVWYYLCYYNIFIGIYMKIFDVAATACVFFCNID
ncbi:hypothetical protein ACJX0J_030895, partial [Zea mays]